MPRKLKLSFFILTITCGKWVFKWVFSFARMTEDEWLLISVAQIIDTPFDDWADVKVLDRFAPLFGRVIIK